MFDLPEQYLNVHRTFQGEYQQSKNPIHPIQRPLGIVSIQKKSQIFLKKVQ